MLTATLIGIFLIPVFYVVLQRVSERHWPFRPEGTAAQAGNAQAAPVPGSGHA
jgi:HAE1 family hydrophobic/amphiphilic exporter-1/multidrug efflux pump